MPNEPPVNPQKGLPPFLSVVDGRMYFKCNTCKRTHPLSDRQMYMLAKAKGVIDIYCLKQNLWLCATNKDRIDHNLGYGKFIKPTG